MSFCLQRYLKGQTKFGVFQNLFFPGDCGGIKYVMVHIGSWRFNFTWKERQRREYPSVTSPGYGYMR
jgi:hypothetical protein